MAEQGRSSQAKDAVDSAGSALSGRISTRGGGSSDVSWSRSALVDRAEPDKPPTPRWRRFGWWLLPLLLLAWVLASLWGINHIENDVEAAARDMLDQAGIDHSQLEFDASFRDVDVTGTLPAGVSADRLKQVLEEGKGRLDGEDIRTANVGGVQGAPAALLGEIAVAVTSDGSTITLNGNVPSDAHANALEDAARASGANVAANLTVSDLEPSAIDADARIGSLANVLPALGAGISAADLRLNDDGLVGTIDTLDADTSASIGSLVADDDVTVTAPAPLGSLDVTANWDGTRVVLAGEVLTEDQSAELEAAAVALAGDNNVINNLEVLNLDPALEGADGKIAALAGSITTLGGMQNAEAKLTDTDLTITGTALDEAGQAAVIGSFDAASAAGLKPGDGIDVLEDPGTDDVEIPIEEEVELLQAELDALQAEILENVVFATDSADLSDEAKGTLDKVVEAMNRYRRPVVETGGHTDSRGTDTYNLGLSQRRADSVVAHLVSAGVDADRLNAVGFGEAIAIADNTFEAGRAQNRRVEFIAKEAFG